MAFVSRSAIIATTRFGLFLAAPGFVALKGGRFDNMAFKPNLVSCEQSVQLMAPLAVKSHIPKERHLMYRIFRGLIRVGWICLKLVPGLLAIPFALVSSSVSRLWWNYTVWVLVSSGPTAIKFAQWVGTRPDIFPDSAIESLSRLHSVGVSSYSLSDTIADLDAIYGSENWPVWLELLDDAKLIGSGAIAHVSRGRIIEGSDSGKEVALKIVHRGVREIIEADLDIMRFVAWTVSGIPSLASLDAPGAIDEFGKFIHSQTNMLTEAENISKFSNKFQNRKHIKFPTIFLSKCRPDILVESFEEGIPLGDIIKNGSIKLKKKTCDLGISAFLKMLFVDNFVHGDLHPGNVLFQPAVAGTTIADINNSGVTDGQLLILDCGLVAQLNVRDERNFLDVMHSVVTGNSLKIGQLMIDRSRSPRENVVDSEKFCAKVAELVDKTVTGRSLIFGGIQFGAVITQLLNIARQHHVGLETSFVSVACALIVLEGVGKQLDPTRNLLWEAEPYILRQFLRRAAGMMEE